MSEIKLTQIEPAFASPMMLFQVLDCDVLNRSWSKRRRRCARVRPD